MGAAASSFVQLAVDRAGGAVGLLGRSRCHRCATGLRAWEVLPIAGFLLLRGRCRSCGTAIPRHHLVGEVAVGVFWTATIVLLGPVVWLPVVLVAPLVVMLLRSPVRAAGRALLAGLLPLVGWPR
jgi:leader peptidase (prepilin peptidase)/N-methyltransferase